jgi:hypothetical protein
MQNTGVHDADYEHFYETEKQLQLQPVSRTLEHTRVLLFKAMKSDETVKSRIGTLDRYVKNLPFNNVDKLLVSTAQINVAHLYDVTHWSILQSEDIIQREILRYHAESIYAEAELELG